MIWYALLIPMILTLISYVLWNKAYFWAELIIPTAASLFFIIISYFFLKNKDIQDVEYNGYIINECRYYESWETWVEQTCSYTTCDGYDSKGNCTGYTTHYYDCSYCDYNAAYWIAIDNFGNQFSISKQKYENLIKQWSAQPQFHELNRSIRNHGSCGKDGDMYSIKWDGKIETSESDVIIKPFQNILKVNHSAFQFPDISDEQADSLKLYKYPEFYDYYKQQAIFNLGYLGVNYKDGYQIQKKFEYLNGNLGPKFKVKVFTLLFLNKPIDIAFKQEAYWDGGNQNEVIVCIGINDKQQIEWVKPFSWCDNKRIIVDIREDIAELKTFKPDEIYNIYEKNISKYFHYKSFEDFNYLSFEPTFGQLVFVYIITLLISCFAIWFCVTNNIEEENY